MWQSITIFKTDNLKRRRALKHNIIHKVFLPLDSLQRNFNCKQKRKEKKESKRRLRYTLGAGIGVWVLQILYSRAFSPPEIPAKGGASTRWNSEVSGKISAQLTTGQASKACRRKWHPTPVFLPGKPHGRRSLASWGPWGLKESDKTKHELKGA